MKLYNTLTRKIDTLQPLVDKQIRIYSCGPTVYDHAHIGNLSAYIFADTLRRVISASGLQVSHAMNYTDVDDKTIRRSQEKFANINPHEALAKLTQEYIELFLQDMQAIGNDTLAINFLKATDNIDGMKKLIKQLHQGGFAYVADDGVYFSIEAYRNSGKKYGQLLEITASSTSEARIQNDEYDKDSIHDFALWKVKKPGEPAWEFNLDGVDLSGRPGWHIECSVMSHEALGQPFDIHTGGVDLIFPHHENEIAQSTAGQDNAIMAQVFAHNEHILVDGKKMSKSAGNFYTLQQVVDKGFDPLAFRLLILQAHYRSQVNFTWESLEAAQNRLMGYREMAALRWQPVAELPALDSTIFTSTLTDIHIHLEDNLDTTLALTALSAFSDLQKEKLLPRASLQVFTEFLQEIDAVFGLGLSTLEDIDAEQKQLIQKREEARKNKDWALSDQLRNELANRAIGVKDTPHGPIWYRL